MHIKKRLQRQLPKNSEWSLTGIEVSGCFFSFELIWASDSLMAKGKMIKWFKVWYEVPDCNRAEGDDQVWREETVVASAHVHGPRYSHQTYALLSVELGDDGEEGTRSSYGLQPNITGAVRKKRSGKCFKNGLREVGGSLSIHLWSGPFCQYDIRSQDMRTWLETPSQRKTYLTKNRMW